MQQKNPFGDIRQKHESDILTDWIKTQFDSQRSPMTRMGLVREAELRELCKNFLHLFIRGLQNHPNRDPRSPEWKELKDLMSGFSRGHALQAYTPSETASFIFLLKKRLFVHIGQELGKNSDDLYQAIWAASEWIDALGLTTMEFFQKACEELIHR